MKGILTKRTRGEAGAPGCLSQAWVATFGLHPAAFLWSLPREPEVKARLQVVPLGLSFRPSHYAWLPFCGPCSSLVRGARLQVVPLGLWLRSLASIWLPFWGPCSKARLQVVPLGLRVRALVSIWLPFCTPCSSLVRGPANQRWTRITKRQPNGGQRSLRKPEKDNPDSTSARNTNQCCSWIFCASTPASIN